MQPIAAVTFDFHNTLVSGESWLDLEIRTLPGAVLTRLVAGGHLPAPAAAPAMLAAAETAYRAVREEAKAGGREVSALAGVMRVLDGLGWRDGRDRAAVTAALAAAQQACLVDTAVVPGAADVLTALRAAGVRLAVVSSAAYPAFVRWALARYDLARYFPVVATSAEVGYYKSDPRLYAWALAHLDVPAAAAVHVGDHPRFDVQGAAAAHMRTVWLDRPEVRRPGPAPDPACRPDATIARLAELPAALARLGPFAGAGPPAP